MAYNDMVASGLNSLNHNLSQSLSPGMEQSHFLLNEHIHPVYRLRQWILMTSGNTKAKIKLKHVGQTHLINVSYWLDWAKTTASLHLCNELLQKHTHLHIMLHIKLISVGKHCVSLSNAAMVEGAWLWPPSGRIMSSEPDSEATQRNIIMQCTIQHNVGAKQTMVLPFLFECLIL